MLNGVKRLFSKSFELTENVLVLRERIAVGRRLEEILNGQDWEVLKEHVLLPLQIGAFEAFKKVNADDVTQVLEIQMMSKMLDAIQKEIQIKINQGQLAQEQLKTLPELSGEEEE